MSDGDTQKSRDATNLLLLQQHGVSLVRNTTNVQWVAAVWKNLAKVSGVAELQLAV
jgi:hypothetical protein